MSSIIWEIGEWTIVHISEILLIISQKKKRPENKAQISKIQLNANQLNKMQEGKPEGNELDVQ